MKLRYLISLLVALTSLTSDSNAMIQVPHKIDLQRSWYHIDIYGQATGLYVHAQALRLNYRGHKDLNNPQVEINGQMTPLYLITPPIIALTREGKDASVHLLLLTCPERDRLLFVNTQDCFGKTALMEAASLGNTDLVQALLKHGAIVDLQDVDNNTALILACKEGHFTVAQQLIKERASVDMQNKNGETALLVAVKNKHLELFLLLRRAKANALIPDSEGVDFLSLMENMIQNESTCHNEIETDSLTLKYHADCDTDSLECMEIIEQIIPEEKCPADCFCNN